MTNVLVPYFKAAYPALAIEVTDEARLEKMVIELLDLVKEDKPSIVMVDGTGLCLDITDPTKRKIIDRAMRYDQFFDLLASKSCIGIAYDWHRIADNFGPLGYRALLARLKQILATKSVVLLPAPSWDLPQELRPYVPVLEISPPTREELDAALKVIEKNSGKKAPDNIREALLDAASGLSMLGAENAIALSLITHKEYDPLTIEKEKIRLIRQQNGLEIAAKIPLEDIGGLDNLKRWMTEEVIPNRKDPLLTVKAMLLVGPPGTGKSYTAKAIGYLTGWPVVRLDLAGCRGQYVGQTEATVKAALRTVDAVAPCVLWLDEIDSALGGHASSAMTDGGVTLAVLSILLTWMQEHTSEVLMVATANYPERIPAALLRPGRMDAIWCVDLPSYEERKEIAAIHLRKVGCDNKILAGHTAKFTEGFSGAEIAGAVLSAARKTRRKINMEAIEVACKEITPLSKSRADELNRMREWAKNYARTANKEVEIREGVRNINL